MACPQASIPGAWGLIHQPTTPPASLATPHAPFASSGCITIESTPAMERLSTLYFRKSATLRSLPRLPCSNQKRVMSIRPAGLAACQRQIAPTKVLWMSSGSAPTVLARMSVVRTSHSLSRFGYCCWELLLRGTPPEPALTAVPPTDSEQPVKALSVVIEATTAARTRLLIIWSSQSTDEPVLWLYRTPAGTAFG